MQQTRRQWATQVCYSGREGHTEVLIEMRHLFRGSLFRNNKSKEKTFGEKKTLPGTSNMVQNQLASFAGPLFEDLFL